MQAFGQFDFFGEKLGKMSSFNILIPEGDGPFPVLYLLHGYSDNHTAWSRFTSLERYIADRKLIVVMPDGHVSFYINNPFPGGLPYEDHIVYDVVDFVDRHFNTLPQRDGRALAGLSMGGYGAMLHAIKHADRFCCASSLSGALGVAHMPTQGNQRLLPHLEAGIPIEDICCFEQAKRLPTMDTPPAIRFDCGTDDFLYKQNVAFHEHLDELDVEHIYKAYPGIHNWDYWDQHIPETLDFVMEHLAAE